MRYNKSAAPVDVEIPTTDLYVDTVMGRSSCVNHEAEYFQPCYGFESIISDAYIIGICNSRAKKAGMNAPVRAQSMSMSISGQSYRGQQ